MMRIKQLEVENFRVFLKKEKFDFSDADLILCDAPNGSGKTTMLDAIEWCLTGNIGRLSDSYSKRLSKSDQKKNYNLKTILKNKKCPKENTIVSLKIMLDDNKYTITREQKDDTLLDPGKVTVYDMDNNLLDKEILEEWVQKETFYQYHVFDMQKAYNFLGKDKQSVEKFFVDFTRQYNEPKRVVNNLNVFRDDINLKKQEISGKKISKDKLKDVREKIAAYVEKKEMLQYEKKLLFENENVEIISQSKEEMDVQLQKLYRCGYSKASEIIKTLLNGQQALEIKTHLENVEREILQHPKEILKVVEKELYNENFKVQLENELLELQKMSLTKDNIELKHSKIIEFQRKEFTKDYWNVEWEKVLNENSVIEELRNDINILGDGNNVLNLLTSLIADKNSVIEYRNQLRNNGEEMICPLCGSSETFSEMEDEEILQQAQKYSDEHAKLLGDKKKKLKAHEDAKNQLMTDIVERAKNALKEKTTEVSSTLKEIVILNEICKNYTTYVERLQSFDSKKYSFENLKEYKKVENYIEEINRDVVGKEKSNQLEKDVKDILIIIGYNSEGKSYEEILKETEIQSREVPRIVEYSNELLSKKITSLQQCISNKEIVSTKNQLEKWEETNRQIDEKIDELTKLNDLVGGKIDDINKVLLDLRKEEYAMVGPYLSKIFQKLSRDIHIKEFRLSKRDSNQGSKELDILDEEGRPILNMFSDGQLSVFMMSYFLGNAFRLADKEKMSIYMMDDVTSCMDDINMLAFLDLIKYQLKTENGAFSQLFFSSCNERIHNLLEWKANGCGIKCKRIVLNEVQN